MIPKMLKMFIHHFSLELINVQCKTCWLTGFLLISWGWECEWGPLILILKLWWEWDCCFWLEIKIHLTLFLLTISFWVQGWIFHLGLWFWAGFLSLTPWCLHNIDHRSIRFIRLNSFSVLFGESSNELDQFRIDSLLISLLLHLWSDSIRSSKYG